MLLFILAIVATSSCSKKPPPSHDEAKKPRLDVTVWIDPKGEVPEDNVAVFTDGGPPGISFVERGDLKFGVIHIPAEGDPGPLMELSVGQTHWSKGSAAIILTKRCLRDLVPTFQKNLLPFWNVALVVGAHCDGPPVEPMMAAAAMIETGAASKVRITFDRRTKVFLRVEPLP